MESSEELWFLVRTCVSLALLNCTVRQFISARDDRLFDIRRTTWDVQQNAGKWPKWLTQPSYSPVMYMFLASTACFLVYTVGMAIDTFPHSHEHEVRAGDFKWYCTLVLVNVQIMVLYHSVALYGRWIMLSFTMTSWNLQIAHGILCLMGPFYPQAVIYYSQFIRFPMIAFNTVTFTVWWAALFPLGLVFIKDSKAKEGWIKMQFEFTLINVHFLNFPMSLIHAMYLCQARMFTFFDLYAGFFCAITYLIFYLAYMERNSIHYYIILSPRTHLCFFTYLGLTTLFSGSWLLSNLIIQQLV